MSACVLCERIAKIAVRTVDRGCTEAEAEAARIKLAQLKAVHDPDACAGRMRPFSGFFASAEAEDLWNEILRRTGEEVKAACARWEAERNARTRQQAESDDWQRRTAKARRKRKKKDKPETLEEMFKRWAREAKREGRSTARDTNANRAAEFAREWERDPQGVESKTVKGVAYTVKKKGGRWHASRDGQYLARTFRTSVEAKTALFEVFEQEPATAG